MSRHHLIIAAAAALLGLGIWALRGTEAWQILADPGRLRDLIETLGLWGPAAVIALRTLAGLFAVIPNSPIGVVAGLAFGGLWGFVYVIVGTQLGAVIAFLIARGYGFKRVERWGWIKRVQATRWGGWLLDRRRSQAKLALVVLVARLVPFVNLDVFSYVAGVTRLSFWRYNVATLLGSVPYTLVLVYLGQELAGAGATKSLVILAVLGLLCLAPLAVQRFRDGRAGTERSQGRDPQPEAASQQGSSTAPSAPHAAVASGPVSHSVLASMDPAEPVIRVQPGT